MKRSRRDSKPSMYRELCPVVSQKKIAEDHYVLTFRSAKIPKNAKPGQFVQILCQDSFDPLLPRPFSFLTADKNGFSVLYHVVGIGTKILSQLKIGESLWVLGPCGNGFSAPAATAEKTFLLAGGGVGIPPLYHFAQHLLTKKIPKKNITVFLGARDKSLLLLESDFKKLGVNLVLSTDNGSKGAKGFLTVPLERFLKQRASLAHVYTCGPTAMMKAVSKIAEAYKVPCQASVEVPMACGFGACLGCAIKVKDGGQDHRYAIACCEGPVFAGSEILWD